MFPDFYATAAQVLPVLMLALIWESRFLDRLTAQNRRPRRTDPDGVLFWTRPRVRAYSLFIVATIMTGTALALLVLAGAVPPGEAPRAVLTGCALLALATLLTRVVVDVVAATRPPGGEDEPVAAPVETDVGHPPGATPPAVEPRGR
ncbi:hypothetical protein [Micromonospora sp. KC723]|uniref:hypothetical protein n=1 Tax=Micromonospora sp. KC723 TaxID=2530381 RepID=UPI0010518605|nr:hypothetical protein [Micromonospora sp. KC723]TDB70334.1 hypothetical protein E1165_26050 [Micromonospora sp. KC723]